jgi:thymidylate synthase (FAD)
MHFLGLRTERENATFPSYPQREIEMVANEMEDFFKDKMPMTWEAFNENGRVSP